jgi:hypothetical protein
MNRRWTLVAALGAALAVAMAAAVAVAAATAPGRGYAAFGGQTAGDQLPSVAVNLTAGLLGALILARRPGNRIGMALLTIGVAFNSTMFLAVTMPALTIPPAVATWLAWFGNWVWMLGQGAAYVLLFTFPSGTPLSPRWRTVLRAVLVGTALALMVLMLIPGPLEAAPWLDNPLGVAFAEVLVAPVFALMVLSAVLGIAHLVVRFRHSTGDERLQLRWVAYGAGVYGVTMLVQVVPGVPDLGLLDLSGPLLLVGAVGVAVTKYRLYEIDRLISRTVSYAIVTAMLVGLYLASVTILTSLTAPVTRESPVAVAVATLLAAAAFQPLRLRIQQLVDRRFNRASFDAAREVEAYRGRLRGQLELASVGDDLVGTVQSTLEPAAVSLWLPSGDRP